MDSQVRFCALLVDFPSQILPHFETTPLPFARCQTYEGGFAAMPGAEAHGGYAFCGLAALYLIGDWRDVNLRALLVSSEL